jgi:pyridoxine 5-phosphate synthase
VPELGFVKANLRQLPLTNHPYAESFSQSNWNDKTFLMMTKLSINVNAVAQLRNRRDLPWPSVTGIARVALEAGAYGITVHPRPDERHIRRMDVGQLGDMLRKSFPGKEFNIEGYPSEEFVSLIDTGKPDQVTLVPDDPNQSTSDHGWTISGKEELLKPVISRFRSRGIRVSLFVDADPAVPALARAMGADRVELYTGPFGAKLTPEARADELAKLRAAAEAARAAGLGVNAGHDLTRENLPELVAAVPFLEEVSIGHAAIADALLFGMAETVRLFRAACGDPVK